MTQQVQLSLRSASPVRIKKLPPVKDTSRRCTAKPKEVLIWEDRVLLTQYARKFA
jgi:hypothetical protein